MSGAAQHPDVEAFEASERERGESVLSWVLAEGGTVILTDRRLCHVAAGAVARCVTMTGATLRYQPTVAGERIRAAFETDDGPIEFVVDGAEERGHLGNLLGNLAELREALGKLEQAGIDPRFVSPPREAGGEGVSAAYQLIRLKEMLNQGLFSEIEFLMQRTVMVGRLHEQFLAASGP